MNGVFNIQADASNVKDGTNPPFLLTDFKKFYPQFSELPELPDLILEQFIGMANAYINIDRWKSTWTLGMCLFVAHFSTLYLQTFAEPNAAANQVMSAAQAKGLITSKSVGDVSVSYDFSSAVNGLDGWANWTSTAFGIQLASFAKILGKGNMYVY